MSLFFGKKRLKSFLRLKRKNGCGRGGSRGRGCHMALPYGSAIWQSHMAMPYGNAIWHCHMAEPYGEAIWFCHIQDFGRGVKKWDLQKKKWDLFQIPNIVLVTHDDLLKISIWPRVEKLVPSTPRGSRYDFYAQLDQNLWPSWRKSGKNMKLCENELQKNIFWLLRSSPGSVFHFKSI